MLKQEGYDLMGAAFEVYNVLGYGMADASGPISTKVCWPKAERLEH